MVEDTTSTVSMVLVVVGIVVKCVIAGVTSGVFSGGSINGGLGGLGSAPTFANNLASLAMALNIESTSGVLILCMLNTQASK